MATHGIPETVSSDNGPPYPSDDMETYAAEKGFSLTPVSPCDPQCNGFAENFIKQLCKLVHTSVVECRDPKVELYNYLLQYRETPHGSTGLSPAEMLFGRKIQTKFPQIFVQKESEVIKKARQRHDQKKADQKKHFDRRNRAKSKEVKVGDQVLIKQKKTTLHPPYDPKPFVVTGVNINAVDMQRDDGTCRKRDKNQIKAVRKRPQNLKPSWQSNRNLSITDYSNFEIERSSNQSDSSSTTNAIPNENGETLFELPRHGSSNAGTSSS